MSDQCQDVSLNGLLVQVCRLHHARAHGLLDELGLYRGQPPLLHVLAHAEGLSHSELATRLHVTPATVSKMVQRMVKVGVVTTWDDPEDQRVSRVRLTEEGRRLHAQAETQMRQLEAEAFAGFSPEEISFLRRCMDQIRENLIQVVGDKALTHPHGRKHGGD